MRKHGNLVRGKIAPGSGNFHGRVQKELDWY
jgi:hypothetical protein